MNSAQVKVGSREDSDKDQEEEKQDAVSIKPGKCQEKKRNRCETEPQEDMGFPNKVSKQGTNSTQGKSSVMQMTGLTDICSFPLIGSSSDS